LSNEPIEFPALWEKASDENADRYFEDAIRQSECLADMRKKLRSFELSDSQLEFLMDCIVLHFSKRGTQFLQFATADVLAGLSDFLALHTPPVKH